MKTKLWLLLVAFMNLVIRMACVFMPLVPQVCTTDGLKCCGLAFSFPFWTLIWNLSWPVIAYIVVNTDQVVLVIVLDYFLYFILEFFSFFMLHYIVDLLCFYIIPLFIFLYFVI